MEITRCLARHRPGVVAALLCVLGTMPCCWASSGLAKAQTPDAFAQNKRLGRGVNVLGYDPIWKDRQKGRFQEKYFRLIKEAGFNHVRVNLYPFRDNKPGLELKLRSAWCETLDWVLKHALTNRLMVVLDFHEYEAMGRDPAGNKERFLAAWKQIAEHCKDAPDDVLFEVLNEPHKKLTPGLWNPLLRESLGIIRQTNPRRTVIVGPTSWNDIKDLDKLDLPQEERNLIVTVHYYDPFQFTHQGRRLSILHPRPAWPGTARRRSSRPSWRTSARPRHGHRSKGVQSTWASSACTTRQRWPPASAGRAS